MRLLKIITIYVLIIFSCLCAIVSYFLTTEHGAKLLLINCINYISPKNTNTKFLINKISGNVLTGLILEDLIYLQAENNLTIKYIQIKLNWLEFITKQNLAIIIKKLAGTFNNHPIEASINFSKQGNNLQLNSNSFIKIGNNVIDLSLVPNESNIKFNLVAKQLEIFHKNASGTITINGKISNNLNELTANITTSKLIINKTNVGSFLENSNNHLNINITKTNKQDIIAEIFLDFQDLSPIMNFIPDITRLKGKLNGSIKFNLNRLNPNISTNLALKDLTMSLPEYGVKIKPLNIAFTAKNDRKIIITGKGFMRNGPGEFNLTGYFEPFSKHFTNMLEISAQDLEFINTPEYHLIGSMKLKLMLLLAQNALQITGNTCISQGVINLDKQTASKIIKSNDIIFINQIHKSDESKKNYFNVLPDLDLRIEPNTKLIGKGLNTIISGKLKIYTTDLNDALLGDGRITIKHGTYTLSGQEFIIEKGRIIYLPRTFISNPTLDIKILPNTETTSNKDQEKYLYIEGTLQNPIIKDSGLANEHQAILQLLNFGNNKITSGIKEKLHLHEFGIQEDNDAYRDFKNKPTEESLLDNKNFVIGKKLNNKTHLQYLKTLNTANSIVRVKYKLNNHWSIGIESSTENGHGADLGFCIEK